MMSVYKKMADHWKLLTNVKDLELLQKHAEFGRILTIGYLSIAKFILIYKIIIIFRISYSITDSLKKYFFWFLKNFI
jgi:hypothetical protein